MNASLRSLTFVGCQSDRSLQKRGRGGHASPRLRAASASFELSRNLFVRGRGGRGQMPGPAVRVDVPVCRLGQCEVHAPALIDRRGSVHRGANERMTERHRLLDREQPVRDVSRTSLDPEPLGCTPDEQRIADRLGGGDEQQAPRRVRKRLDSPLEALLEPGGQLPPRSVVQTEPAGKLLH